MSVHRSVRSASAVQFCAFVRELPSLRFVAPLAMALPFVLSASCQREPAFSVAVTQSAIALSREVNPANLSQHVRELVAQREKETPQTSLYWGNMKLRRVNAGQYIDSYLSAQGLTVVHERDDQQGVDTDNLYVDLPARAGSAHAAEYVLVSGHYDNWHVGADDNASAVSVMLEAARILRTRSFLRTIRIIAFDREEEGLVGSERYARLHQTESVAALLNMDCVGYASHQPNSQSAPPGLALRSVGDFLAILASDAGTPAMSKVIRLSAQLPSPVSILGLIAPGTGHSPAAAAFLRSDHAAFWQQGVPALFLTDTADFRNPHYHRSSDVPDTLDYDFLQRSAQLVIAATAALAEEE